MLKYFTSFIFTACIAIQVHSQTNPVINSWIRNTTSATNPSYTSLESNVQTVHYTTTDAYVSASSVPAYTIGPWTANPNNATDQNEICKFTLNPTVNNGTKTNTSLGAIGLWINGVQIYNAKDGYYWNNTTSSFANGTTQTGWNRNAYYWEGISFDACKGHPGPNGAYHHHVAPVCLYNANITNVHSPIIGFANDGFPIYGPYGYTNTNGTGAIKRITSSYVLSTATSRTLGPPVNTTYPLGSMCEDYVYTASAGDLDQYNGRTCVTPEYPSGTYAYFVTIDASGTPAYPFVLASKFYGTVAVTGPTVTSQTIPTNATLFANIALPLDLYDFTAHVIANTNDVLLRWQVQNQDNVAFFEIEKSSDGANFKPFAKVAASQSNVYSFTDNNTQASTIFYRIKSTDNNGLVSYSYIISVLLKNNEFLLMHNNPANDVLNIQENKITENRTIEIFDMYGKIVLKNQLPIGTIMKTIDVQTLYPGMYIIKVSNNQNAITSKLIIQKK